MDRQTARSLPATSTHPRSTSVDSRVSDTDSIASHDAQEPISIVSKTWSEKGRREHASGEEVEPAEGSIGILPDDVYEKALGWQIVIRRMIVRNLVWESKVIAAMQERVRRPFLDVYFVNSSTLGTHTFFMTMLPSVFFFGHLDVAWALLTMLAFGVYIASLFKDWMCAPRPFAPPVTRLTLGTHHLEYGFPSTHSTNSISMALYFFTVIHRLYTTPVSSPGVESLALNATQIAADVAPQMQISGTTYAALVVLLVVYVFSVVYGRIYAGMHSFTDCTFGLVLGTAIWWLFYMCGDALDVWIKTSGWIVPAVIIPTCLLMVHRHPEPVDDCPCFEDAIAFMAVVMGNFLTRWYMAGHGYDETFFHRMPGHMLGEWADMWTWWSTAAAKMVVGILTIFAWRIFAKSLLHRMLPPLFRFLAQLVTLPHRRFYTPATDYKGVPADTGLHPIPSVLDLPRMVELQVDGESTGRKAVTGQRTLKQRAGRGLGSGPRRPQAAKRGRKGEGLGLGLEELGGKEVDVVKHYDADVLTKVFVYCGIGILATGVMPVVFEVIGWGL